MASSNSWFFWAVLSAVFAALTAIFAKIGIQGVDSDLATLIRTAIIMGMLFPRAANWRCVQGRTR